MKKLLFLSVVVSLAITIFVGSVSANGKKTGERNMNSGSGYYCPRCDVELIASSRTVYRPSKEPCGYCHGRGQVKDYQGNYYQCPTCDGTGRKLKLVTDYFLRCPRCGTEYSY